MRRFYVPLLTLVLPLIPCFCIQSQQPGPDGLDLLITHGELIDGSGNPAQKADLGIAGDRIAFVGDSSKASLKAARTIDAAGLVVAPGIIDPHTHTAEDLPTPPRHNNVPYLRQGVTTAITGNDGSSPTPI